MYNDNIKKMPLIPMRGLVIFPYMALHFDVGRDVSIKAIEEAMIGNGLVFLITQIDESVELPSIDDVYDIGTIAKVKQMLKLPGDTIRVLVEGISRARLNEFTQTKSFILGEIDEYATDSNEASPHISALVRSVQDAFTKYFQQNSKFAPETISSIMNISEPGQFADVIAANIMVSASDKQSILECVDVTERLEQLIYVLNKEIEIMHIERNIQIKVKEKIDKNQREYFLREQLKVIQDELGDNEGLEADTQYRKKMSTLTLPDEVSEKLDKEIDRLYKMNQGSPEGSVVHNYIDWVLSLPWGIYTDESIDIIKAKEILEEDHYGLEKVKERILEHLSVKKLSGTLKGTILCLVGPPGVGKTSIVKSIARSLRRNYVRISLGGVRDEAEIRGHRRTYIGSMPGRIITALKQAKSANPLMLFDEIDKMSSDFKGDPASAMLEVLDGEQNVFFRDHYLELPFDLSKIMFITTANTTDTIPRPLLDRMEVIQISSYIEEEKFNIAKKYLIPKQLEGHGLKKKNLRIDDLVIRDIINYYTREAGVRNLEREIGNLCRKTAMVLVSENKSSISVTQKNLEKFLGIKRYNVEMAGKKDIVGVSIGLAWTSVGGDILYIEVNVMDGSGKLELTGHLGDVMKESAKAAISYIRSITYKLNIDKEFYKNMDIHIHVPEGGTPKDGPSAGITIATALISALLGQPVRHDIAMTGEITLRGRVLPIGGLKEKALAAYRSGITTIIIPYENAKDIYEIPEKIREDIKFIPVHDMDEVIKHALRKSKPVPRMDISGVKAITMPIIENKIHDNISMHEHE